MLLLLGCGLADVSRAQTISGIPPVSTAVEDFESYSNTAALSATWTNRDGSGVATLESTIVVDGVHSLKLLYAVGAAPFTNTVARSFNPPQDWSACNFFSFSCGGNIDNPDDNLIVQFFDHFGGLLGSSVIPHGATISTYTTLSIDLSNPAAFTNAVNHTGLADVGAVALGVIAGAARGSGSFYFDTLSVGRNGNLIANPGFQDINGDGTIGDGWSSFGAQQFLNFFPEVNPGHATFFSSTNGTAGSVWWPSASASNALKYRFTFEAAIGANWNGSVQYGIQFLRANNATLMRQRMVPMLTSNIGTTNYRPFSTTAVAPPGCAFVRPLVSYTNRLALGGASQQLELDNAILTVETNKLLSILGSSVAKGVGSSGDYWSLYLNGSASGSYGALLTRLMSGNQWRVVNQSVSGDTTPRVLARYNRDEMPVGADEVFIGLSLGNEGLPGATNPAAIYNQFYSGITNLIFISQTNGFLPLVGCEYPRDAYTSNEYTYLKSMDLQLNQLPVPVVCFLGATDDGHGHWLTNISSGDGIHPNDAGFKEMFLCFVPGLFDALLNGKPAPQMSANGRFVRIPADPHQPAPLSFTPSSTMHSFSLSFRMRCQGTGTIASVTIPGSLVSPTIEATPAGLIYHSSGGQTINTGIAASPGLWHDVVLTHQYAGSQTCFYVDGVLQGTAREQLTPVRFVLGGRGNAKPRPGSPTHTDFENWFVHRSVLIAEQVAALHQGVLQQGSLEVYAPLDDGAFVPGGIAANLAQSSSTVAVNGTNLLSLPSEHLLFTDGILVLNFNNFSNGLFEVQRSATAAFSNYTVMLVTNAAPNGTITYFETNPPAGSEFYRVRPH